MAAAFITSKNSSSTMIAADVRSTNARSGLSAHKKICTGKAVAGLSGESERRR